MSLTPTEARLWSPHLLVALLGLLLLLVGRYELRGAKGFLALRQKNQEYQRELSRLQQLETDNKRLHHSIDQLKADPASIEHIAREELHLAKPGEVVFTYPESSEKPLAQEAPRH